MIPYEPDDPAERQRRSMPNPNRMDQCREAGIRHCTKSDCPLFICCEMSVETERINARHGNISLWQVPSEDGEAAHQVYDNTMPYISQPQKSKKKK